MMTLDETTIVNLVTDFLINKTDGNWHKEKAEVANLHEHGVDIKLKGGKRNSEVFLIECKGKSYSKSANSVNKGTNWLFALGQIVTRMDTKRTIQSGKSKGDINRAYKYGLGLCADSAKVAICKIPHDIAKTMNLYIFAVTDDGKVIQFSPSEIGNPKSLARLMDKYYR